MKLHALLSVALSALLLAGAPALADDDDRSTEALLHQMKKARLVDLSHTWEITSPVAGVNPSYGFELEGLSVVELPAHAHQEFGLFAGRDFQVVWCDQLG